MSGSWFFCINSCPPMWNLQQVISSTWWDTLKLIYFIAINFSILWLLQVPIWFFLPCKVLAILFELGSSTTFEWVPTPLGIWIYVMPNVWRSTSWNQMNNMIMIMIMNRWKAFRSLKCLGMIVQNVLEI